MVQKKDGKWRFCIDNWRLNSITKQDAYLLPQIDDIVDVLSGSQYFSTLDLVSSYWQVPLNADSQEKLVFATHPGLRKWKALPFGPTSAPAIFRKFMERVVHRLHWKTTQLYLNDIIVIALDFDIHLQRLEVFQ